MTITIRTGREKSRWICPGCETRIYTGEPVANATWPAQLSLSPATVKLLLVAAAEYRALSKACGKCHHGPHPQECYTIDCYCRDYEPTDADADPVGFVDWVSVDALRSTSYEDAPERDGAPRHNMTGGVAVMQNKGDTHRHPYPMPIQSNGERHTRGMRARTG